MAHIHEDSDTYYLDQLCLIALCGAFGGVGFTLYFWQQSMLNRVLGEQFHIYVLISGILLLVLTGIRAAIFWKSAGAAKNTLPLAQYHVHDHDHAHEHSHEHHD